MKLVLHLSVLATYYFADLAYSREIPGSLRNLYDSIRAQGSCKNPLATGLRLSDSEDDNDDSYTYCEDYKGLVYIQGVNGKLADMDVDCDGAETKSDTDTRCDLSQDTIPTTSFQDKVQKFGINDLNAYVHSYTVFGNEGKSAGFVNFRPEAYGVEPLSVMAVVCGDQMFYGVWADTNGDDRPKAAVGEASIAHATLCYGNGVNGNSGHIEADVLYLAFAGSDVVADASVNWKATSVADFEDSLAKAYESKILAKVDAASAA